ncbi:MAG: hypothetical protein ACYDBV_05290 [Nitrospiria bacterium]
MQGSIGQIINGERETAKKTTTHQEDLIEALKDPREAAAFKDCIG